MTAVACPGGRARQIAATATFLTAMTMTMTAATVAADDGPARFLIVSGPSTHPPGTHESAAGARLLAHLIETAPAFQPAKVEVVSAWPDDAKALDGLSCVIFVGDLFPGETLADPSRIKADIQNLADRAVGLVCLHYATGLHAEHVTPEGDHPLLRWIGGYFASGCAHHKSTARVVTTTLEPAGGDHPILRGWSAVKLEDEPYWNNYFGPTGMAKNVTALVTAMVPPEDPRREVVGWAIQRPDGGRGAGLVVPHFYRNWRDDDLRTLILNTVAWSSRREVPSEGVKTPKPDLNQFGAQATEPAAPKAKAKAKIGSSR
jgi:type 1 glutamine amidotransferase